MTAGASGIGVLEVSTAGRLERERQFWDQLYENRSGASAKTFAERYVAELAYTSRFLVERLGNLRNQTFLSLGGGVDRFGIELACRGNTVVSVDVSPVAAALTGKLASLHGVRHRVFPVVGDCEMPAFRTCFDVVLARRALHHMNIHAAVLAAVRLIKPGGLFIAEEPICFLSAVRWLHRRVPFHPDPVRTPDEKELTREDVAFISSQLSDGRVRFFDGLTRESIVYFLTRAGFSGGLKHLAEFDFVLANRFFPALKPLYSYVVVEGRRPQETADAQRVNVEQRCGS